MVTLEVGKSYITGFYNKEDPVDGAVVRIRGTVDEDTREHKRGYRFYSESGIRYLPNGTAECVCRLICDNDGVLSMVVEGLDGNPKNIMREAYAEDLRQAHEEFAAVSLAECKDNPNFIPRGHPDFIMKLGGLYVDRMGIYRFITEILGEGSGRRFLTSDRNSYWKDGFQGDQDRPSMTDIAYQKV